MAKHTFTIAGNSFELEAQNEMIATMLASDRARALGYIKFFWVDCPVTGGSNLEPHDTIGTVDLSHCDEVRMVKEVAGPNGFPHLYIRRAQLAELVA